MIPTTTGDTRRRTVEARRTYLRVRRLSKGAAAHKAKSVIGTSRATPTGAKNPHRPEREVTAAARAAAPNEAANVKTPAMAANRRRRGVHRNGEVRPRQDKPAGYQTEAAIAAAGHADSPQPPPGNTHQPMTARDGTTARIRLTTPDRRHKRHKANTEPGR